MNISRVRLGVRTALPHLRAQYERLGYHFVEAHSHFVILEKVISLPTPLSLEAHVASSD